MRELDFTGMGSISFGNHYWFNDQGIMVIFKAYCSHTCGADLLKYAAIPITMKWWYNGEYRL